MSKVIKRYRVFLVVLVLLGIVFLVDRELGRLAFQNAGYTIKEMLLIIPPIFVLLGLLDVWIPRETMVRFMGEGSGAKGVLLAFLLGSAAAGPLYGAFPVASVFMRKGVKFSNILVFLGAWSTTKIPMFLFELESLGPRFALTRLAINIPGILIIAWTLATLVPKKTIDDIYRKNLEMNNN
ncbi:MAG: permease [Sphaerochaetaceae bacterium]